MAVPERKTRPGTHFLTMESLRIWLGLGHWVYLRGKPMHPSIIHSMTFRTVEGFLDNRSLRRCMDNTKEATPYVSQPYELSF